MKKGTSKIKAYLNTLSPEEFEELEYCKRDPKEYSPTMEEVLLAEKKYVKENPDCEGILLGFCWGCSAAVLRGEHENSHTII